MREPATVRVEKSLPLVSKRKHQIHRPSRNQLNQYRRARRDALETIFGLLVFPSSRRSETRLIRESYISDRAKRSKWVDSSIPPRLSSPPQITLNSMMASGDESEGNRTDRALITGRQICPAAINSWVARAAKSSPRSKFYWLQRRRIEVLDRALYQLKVGRIPRPGQKCNTERSGFTCERRVRMVAISRVLDDTSPFTGTRDNSHNLCDLSLPMRSELVHYFNKSDMESDQTRFWGYGKGSSREILVACIPNSQEIRKDTCYVLRSVHFAVCCGTGQDNQMARWNFIDIPRA